MLKLGPGRTIRRWIRPVVLLICLAGIGWGAAFGGAGEKTRVEKWLEDIDQLARELPRRHINLYAERSEREFFADISALKAGLEEKNDSEILFGLSRIVAAFGDAHTMLGFRPKAAFPLTFYWFSEGIHCVAAAPEFAAARDCRLIKIGSFPVEEAVEILSRAFPYENRSQLKKSVTGYLVFAEMLHGAGLIDDPDRATFTLENVTGDRFEISCPAVSFSSGARPRPNPRPMPEPLYRRLADQAYAFEYLNADKTLYLAYNSCRDMREKPFSEFTKQVFETVDLFPVERFVIDLRSNGGGDSSVFEPLIAGLEKHGDLYRRGRLFVVIGRGTFSSAVLNAIQLKNRTRAVFVGEPSGGKPNHFGEVKMFRLANSGLPVTYSTKFFTMWEAGGDALEPDIPVEVTFKDYLNNRDPVLERISAGNGARR